MCPLFCFRSPAHRVLIRVLLHISRSAVENPTSTFSPWEIKDIEEGRGSREGVCAEGVETESGEAGGRKEKIGAKQENELEVMEEELTEALIKVTHLRGALENWLWDHS